nr:diguanylate cyclase [Candidatus Mycolicibacterium alkanivorans]
MIDVDSRIAYANSEAVALCGAATSAEVENHPVTGFVGSRVERDIRATFMAIAAGTALRRAYRGSPAVQLQLRDITAEAAEHAVLRSFAAAAGAVLRTADVFARWGGEEFIVALPDTTSEQATHILDRVRRRGPGGPDPARSGTPPGSPARR